MAIREECIECVNQSCVCRECNGTNEECQVKDICKEPCGQRKVAGDE